MPEYKLFTYSSDIEVDEEFYLNSTVEDDNIKVEEILKDWLPLEKAIAILDGVSTYGIWLGIGKRPDEVVSRWKEIRPWLPDKISIPKLVNGKAQILTVTEAEAAPITQKVLYKEVEKARKLNDLCESLEEIKSISIKPAWQHPTEIKVDLNGGVNFDGNFAYQLDNVIPANLNTLIDAIQAKFVDILPGFQEVKDPLLGANLADCKPDPNARYDGLCGAWYIMKVQTNNPVFTDQNGSKTNQLEVLIPVGLIKIIKNGTNSSLTKVSFLEAETEKEVCTYGLEFRFLCEKAETEQGQRSSAEQINSKFTFLNAKLKTQNVNIDSFDHNLMVPFEKFNNNGSRDQWLTDHSRKIDLAKKIAPEIVGKEPLAIFTETGVHLLEDEKQIGAWFAVNQVLDKLFYAPPWRNTAPWLKKKYLRNVFKDNDWAPASKDFPGGRESLEDEVIGMGDAKDYSQQLLTVFASRMLGKRDEDQRSWDEKFNITIGEFRSYPSADRKKLINELWTILTTPGPFSVKSQHMFEPRTYNERERDSLPTAWHLKKEPLPQDFTRWRDYCVGFRVDGKWNEIKDTINRYSKDEQGITQWRRDDALMLKIRKLSFKDTILDGVNWGVEARMWNVNNDTFNETAVCVSRNFFGATAFPERGAIGEYALFAVDCYDLVGFDTEAYQRDLGPYKVWRPGEKAFKQIPLKNVIGWVRITKHGCMDTGGWSFSIDRDVKWDYNPKWSSADPQRKMNIMNYIELELRSWRGDQPILPDFDFSQKP